MAVSLITGNESRGTACENKAQNRDHVSVMISARLTCEIVLGMKQFFNCFVCTEIQETCAGKVSNTFFEDYSKNALIWLFILLLLSFSNDAS